MRASLRAVLFGATVAPVITYVGAGAYTASISATPSIPYPSGIQAGDMLVLCSSTRSQGAFINTPSGWTLENNPIGGIGATITNDSGTIRTRIFRKEATGAESGSLAVSMTVVGEGLSVGAHQILLFRKTGGTWSVQTDNAVEDTPASSWDQAFSAPVTANVGDMIVTWLGSNGDLCVPNAAMTLGFAGGSNTANAMTLIGNNSSSLGFQIATGANYLKKSGSAQTVSGMAQAFSGTPSADNPTGVVAMVCLRAA